MDRTQKIRLTKTIIIIAVVALIITAVNVFLTIEAKRMFRNDLTTLVYRSTNGLYSLKAGDLNVNLMSGFVSVRDISLDLNQERLSEFYQIDSLPRYYGSIKMKELNFNGVDFRYRKNPEKRKFFLRSIDIIKPQFIIIDNEEGLNTD
ncbi:MAG: hypothetical protein LIO93_01580, partial [Bacteroidales bacterium]|nr:hypothetical protein [Bacteroidales bacterium]